MSTWIYEPLRQFVLELNNLLLALEGECTLETCPMSSKDESIFPCNAHRKTRACCAIEYITHTIDASTTVLVIDRPPLRSRASASAIKIYQSISQPLYRMCILITVAPLINLRARRGRLPDSIISLGGFT